MPDHPDKAVVDAARELYDLLGTAQLSDFQKIEAIIPGLPEKLMALHIAVDKSRKDIP